VTAQNRKHIRIKYPREERAGFFYLGKRHSIVDISQSGMKVVGTDAYQIGQKIAGEIHLLTQKVVPVTGTVVRRVGDLVMVEFRGIIDRNLMKDEVDYIISRFGGFSEADPH
jgi:hypothetical protein